MTKNEPPICSTLLEQLEAKKYTPDQGIDAEMAASNEAIDQCIKIVERYWQSYVPAQAPSEIPFEIGKKMDVTAFRKAFDNMPEEIKHTPHYAWFVELYETAKSPKVELSLIETVAKAIWDSRHDAKWEILMASARHGSRAEKYRKIAKVAIEAIPKREPVQPDKTSPSIACSDAFDLWAEGRPALRSASKRNEARYIWEQSWKSRPKRESSNEWLQMRGLPMAEIKVGMKLKSTVPCQYRGVVVTEITDKGFKYSCEPYYMRVVGISGEVSSGECYGHEGYSMYKTDIEGQS